MIKKVYEVDPLVCPECHGQMRIIAFIANYAAVDKITSHLKLHFTTERPPPPGIVCQYFLIKAKEKAEYS